jgi:hypothetical protein
MSKWSKFVKPPPGVTPIQSVHSTSSARQHILGLYRQILRHIQVMPRQKHPKAFQEARNTFRTGKNELNPDEAAKLIKNAEARLGFLRMTTPSIGRFKPKAFKPASKLGETSLVYDKGVASVGRGKYISRKYAYRQLEEADINRHYEFIERFHFRGPHWEESNIRRLREQDIAEYGDYTKDRPEFHLEEGEAVNVLKLPFVIYRFIPYP